jgi:signal transduction histidine kinase
MNFKSIQWRLQLWYGLILVAVLVGFGVTAYQLERNRIYRNVDDEIHRRLDLLAQQLHRHHGPPPGGPAGEQRPPPDQLPQGDFPPNSDRPEKFFLPPPVAALFGTNDPANFYFRISLAVESPSGPREIARSDNYPRSASGEAGSAHYFEPINHVDIRPGKPPHPPPPTNFDHDRVAEELLPSSELIEVGCSIVPELRELRLAALELAGFGGGILVIGLAGGGWFVGRALRPISAISATAAKISAGDLAQRIDAAETESELGQLAAVLNSTFARLETAFAQQKQFAADAAHELRTPVSILLTQTQTALARERDAATYRLTLEACQRAAQRMRRLIESLLELARFDAGQEILKRLKFDLAKTVRDCVDTVQTLAEERQVTISAEMNALEIRGDPERVAQVVTNLLTNAIQFNRPQGEVRLKLESQGGLAVLEVADTGHGIAAEDLPRIFERFYRADKSRTGSANSGLGLSICKAVVEAHGGTIEAGTIANGGAKFIVRLPR